MNSPSYGVMYPRAAYLLSLVGGLLIALEGIFAVLAGILLRGYLESVVPGASAAVVVVGIVAVAFGVVILFAAIRLKSNPESARTWGIVIIVLAVLSFLGGGGFFYLGLILALIGGILAATWHPPGTTQPGYGPSGYGPLANAPAASAPWGAPPSPPLPPGVPQRICASCGSPNVATAQFCAKCGAPMS